MPPRFHWRRSHGDSWVTIEDLPSTEASAENAELELGGPRGDNGKWAAEVGFSVTTDYA